MTSAGPLVESMHVQNFACVRDVQVRLTPLHAFIGPNDSGKSTLLRALRTALQLATSIFTANDNQVLPFEPGLRPTTSIFLSFGHGSGYRLTVGEDSKLHENFQWPGTRHLESSTRGWLSPGVGAPALGPFAKAPPSLPFVARLRAGSRLVQLVPRALREPSELIPDGERRDFGDEQGSGLPAILDAVRDRSIQAFLKIEDGARQLFPTFQAIRLRTIAKGMKELSIELRSGDFVPASFASEGLLFYLAFAALQFLDPVGVLLVEQPEDGLHPARIVDIMRILREISQTTQVVLATHSPLVINEMQGDEVTLVTRDPDKGTQVKRLSETPNFAERSKVYALGELWLSYADGIDEAPLLREEPVP